MDRSFPRWLRTIRDRLAPVSAIYDGAAHGTTAVVTGAGG
jgi:hypothetical protein